MKLNRFGLAVAGVASAGAVIAGAAMANASPTLPAALTGYASESGSGSGDQSTTPSPGTNDPTGEGRGDGQCDRAGGGMGRGMHQATEVTGDEAAKVGDAVKAKDSAVTIEAIRKAPDNSYRVLGTKDGNRVMYGVSADLATVTEHQRGSGPGGKRDRGHWHGGQGQTPNQAPSEGATSGASAESSSFRAAV